MRWLSVICIFLALVGCKDKKEAREYDVPVYKFKMSQNDPVSLREICDRIEIVSLPSFRGSADRVKSYKDRYYVQSSQDVFIFDRAGELVHIITSGEKGAI